MWKNWHFNVIFIVGIGGLLLILFSDPLGINIPREVTALIGAMLAFIYQQWHYHRKHPPEEEEASEDGN